MVGASQGLPHGPWNSALRLLELSLGLCPVLASWPVQPSSTHASFPGVGGLCAPPASSGR